MKNNGDYKNIVSKFVVFHYEFKNEVMVRWNKAYIKGTKKIVGVDDECSINVDYVCMACGADMIARRGDKRVHHFAHKENTVNCNPEGYFHKLGKNIFKEIYDNSSEYIIKFSSHELDLKKEYGECTIEIREERKFLKRNADLYIKHLEDESKDISVEIFSSHQITKKKLDEGFRIIEILLPNYSNDSITSNEIENQIKEICKPPLRESEYVRLYNFGKDLVYEEIQSYTNTSSAYPSTNFYNDECLGTDYGRKSTPKFRNYISYTKVSENISEQTDVNHDSNEIPIDIDSPSSSKRKKEISISGYLVEPHRELISPTIYFEVSNIIKNKYPNIRHQPAVLPNYKQIIDVIITDKNKEYWFGIDYRKNEVIKGDFEKKIPNEWKDAVREYIIDLKPIKDNLK